MLPNYPPIPPRYLLPTAAPPPGAAVWRLVYTVANGRAIMAWSGSCGECVIMKQKRARSMVTPSLPARQAGSIPCRALYGLTMISTPWATTRLLAGLPDNKRFFAEENAFSNSAVGNQRLAAVDVVLDCGGLEAEKVRCAGNIVNGHRSLGCRGGNVVEETSATS